MRPSFSGHLPLPTGGAAAGSPAPTASEAGRGPQTPWPAGDAPESGPPSDEPVLIPVSDEPVLIPVGGPAGAAPATQPASSAAAAPVPAAPRPGGYRSAAFLVGLFLAVPTVAASLAALLLPWTDIPQPPGSAAARELANLIVGQELTDQVLGATPPSSWAFVVIPAVVALFGLIGSLMARDSIRGGILIPVVLAAAVGWILTVGWVQGQLPLWTPLARYIQTPGAFATWRPGPPALGLGAWCAVAAVGLLALAGLVNLARFIKAEMGAVAGQFVVTVGGLVYLQGPFRSDELAVAASVTFSEPPAVTPAFGSPNSEVTGKIAVTNRSGRALVMAPAEDPRGAAGTLLLGGPAAAASGSGAAGDPGAWLGDWGRPDLMVLLQCQPSGEQQGQPAKVVPRFPGDGALGCVLRPGETVELTAPFSPVWLVQHVPRETMAGPWTLRLLDADQKLVQSVDFEVPGVEHPKDREVADLLASFRGAVEAADGRFQRLLTASAGAGEGPAGGESLVAEFDAIGQALAQCRQDVEELRQVGVEPPPECPSRLDELDGALAPVVGPMTDLARNLNQGAVAAALEGVQSFLASPASTSEVGEAMVALLPKMVVDQGRRYAAEGDHGRAIQLLAGVDESAVPAAELRRQVVGLLEEGLMAAADQMGLALVGAHGGYGQRAPSPAAPPAGVGQTSVGSPRPIPGAASGSQPEATVSPSVLRSATQRAAAWDPARADRQDLAYLQLVAKQLAGTLQADEVRSFAASRPDYRTGELACWLGMQRLEEQAPTLAVDEFARALRSAYDVTESRTLIPARTAQELLADRREFDALLAVDGQWLASATLAFTARGSEGTRGAVVFLPDALGASAGSRRFLEGLVEFSLEAVRQAPGQSGRGP